MRKKILGFVFAATLLVAMAVPLFGTGTAEAIVHPAVPICNAVGDNAGGTPPSGLPPQAGNGAGGPGQVAQGGAQSGDNACP